MEIGLKERLIGAVVLVILGVIIIPFFLKGPAPDSTVTQSLNLPPVAGTAAAPQEYTLPLNGAPAAGSHAAPAPATGPAVAVIPPSPPAAPQAKPAAAPQAKPAATPKAAAPAAKPAEAAGGKWAVQAGSYGSEANASLVMRKLQGHGLHAFISRFQKGGQSYYRVRVGPYADRSQAEHAMSSVAHAYGGKVEVVPNS